MIVAERTPDGRWQAVDDNQYDGELADIGRGDTASEAILDLLERMEDAK